MENKPFFAKYIAVEGEIKEGDKYIHPLTGRLETAIHVHGSKTHPYQPIKLFLCSRDIQVGDKVINQLGEEFVIKDGGDLVSAKLNKCYKVIGEISPEATWVKEGDEFDEYRWIWEPGEDMETEYLTEEEKQKGRYEIKTWANQIAVKGPCGHWH